MKVIAFVVSSLLFSSLLSCSGKPGVQNSKSVRRMNGENYTVLEIRMGEVDFVFIPGGDFFMGSNQSRLQSSPGVSPMHTVMLDSFWMSKYEITQDRFKGLMGYNSGMLKGKDMPMENASWYDAMKFCKKFGATFNVRSRLPYEAEWEYAARAGSGSAYYRGKKIDADHAWHLNNAAGRTHPVGRKKPNRYGLFDMSGNVREWCMDWYAEDYYQKSPLKNPRGPSTGKYKVIRGGSFKSDSLEIDSAFRDKLKPSQHNVETGFRVVVPLD